MWQYHYNLKAKSTQLKTIKYFLYVNETIDILASEIRFQFSLFELITQLIYTRVISPWSKLKTTSHVFTYLYGSLTISEDRAYDGVLS